MYLVAGAVGKWKAIWAFHLFHSLLAGPGLFTHHLGWPVLPLPFVLHRAQVVGLACASTPVRTPSGSRSSAWNAAVSGCTNAASPALRLWPAAEWQSAARASVPP